MFEAGYSATDHGSGLGLNILREIVEAHGRTVTVTDSDDGGDDDTGFQFRHASGQTGVPHTRRCRVSDRETVIGTV